MEKVLTIVGLVSHRGPDVHCFHNHYQQMLYMGRLQERSYANASGLPVSASAPRLDRNGATDEGELQEGDPIFEFGVSDECGNSLIGQARDRIVKHALDMGAQYLMFFDDDMMIPTNAFIRLWRHQKPVVGGLAFTAREPICPVLYKFHRAFNYEHKFETADIQPIFEYPHNELFRVDAMGTGLMLINMDVFKQLSPSGPWFHGSMASGEDVHFCWQLKKRGIPVYCDTSVKTLHKPNQPEHWMGEERFLEAKGRAREIYEANNRNTNLQQSQAAGRHGSHAHAIR